MITVAWTTRNDDHGGNLVDRMQLSMNALGEYRQAGVDVELVIVEWNPPGHKPLLSQVVYVPTCLPVRWYVVPQQLHRLFPNWERFALWNHIGTNVGMRRAKGDWVLATTHDILWSHQLAQLLAEEAFDPGHFYRAPRYDGSLTYGKQQTTQEAINEIESGEVLRKDYNGKGFFSRSCGDFILMSRDRWNWMRGYPEWPINGIWLDGLLLHILQVGGCTQEVLPAAAYHMNHENGGLEIYGDLPHMPRKVYQKVCAKMLKDRTPVIVNGDGWGLDGALKVKMEKDVYGLAVMDVQIPAQIW